MHKVGQNRNFPGSVLFTDECNFSRDGMFNTHNLHYWNEENPHVTWNRGSQERFSVNIWCGIHGDHLIGPYIMLGRLTGPTYLAFLQDTPPLLFDDVPLQTRRQLWLMHDGAPTHSVVVRDYLNHSFPDRWNGVGGPQDPRI